MSNLDLSRLSRAQRDADAAADAVGSILHATFPPGAAVHWHHAGRTHDGAVIADSGPEWGRRLPVRMIESGRVVHVTPAAILRAVK